MLPPRHTIHCGWNLLLFSAHCVRPWCNACTDPAPQNSVDADRDLEERPLPAPPALTVWWRGPDAGGPRTGRVRRGFTACREPSESPSWALRLEVPRSSLILPPSDKGPAELPYVFLLEQTQRAPNIG